MGKSWLLACFFLVAMTLVPLLPLLAQWQYLDLIIVGLYLHATTPKTSILTILLAATIIDVLTLSPFPYHGLIYLTMMVVFYASSELFSIHRSINYPCLLLACMAAQTVEAYLAHLLYHRGLTIEDILSGVLSAMTMILIIIIKNSVGRLS